MVEVPLFDPGRKAGLEQKDGEIEEEEHCFGA